MSMTLEELKVIIDAEIAPFKKKMQEAAQQTKQAADNVKRQTSGLKTAFSKLAAFAGFAVLGKKLLDLGMYSTQMALEVSAAINQIKRQMGESSQSFLKWINDNANAMNMSVGEATKYAGVYSNLFSTFIKDSDKLSAYTGKMLQTSAVVAEGTGRTMTDVMERIRSGLLGNTEAIEDLGIQVGVSMIQSTNAFKKFSDGKSWDQLDFLTQQQIRLMAILEQATQKYGDTLASTVNGRVNLFKSLLKDAALNIGNSFLPILNAIMPVLNSLAMALKNVTAKLAEFVGLMFNKKATVKDGAIGSANKGMKDLAGGAGDVADALGDADDASGGLSDNLDDTAKSAKKAVKELLGLAGFDEINALKKNDDSDDSNPKSPKGKKGKKGKNKGNGAFKDILPEIGLEDMNNNFKSIFDGLGDKLKGLFTLFNAGFNAAFRSEGLERIKKALDRIKKTLTEIATDPQVVNAFNLMTQRIAYALGQVVGSIATTGVAIGVFVAESIANGLERQKERIKRSLVALFTNVGEIAQSIGNIAQSLANAFYDVMTSIGAVRIGSAIVSAVLSVGATVVELGSNLARDWFRGFEKVITNNAPKLAKVFKTALNNIAPVFETIERAVNDFGNMLTRVYREHVRPVYDDVSKGVSKIVGIFIDGFNTHVNPVIKKFGEGFKKVYVEHVKPTIDKIGESLGGMYDAFKKLWDEILQPFFEWIATNVWPIIAPIIENIGNEFLNTLGLIFDIIGRLFEILRGVIDFLVGVFTGDWSLAWQGILEILHAIFDPIVDWFSEKFQSAYDAITTIFSDIGSWFADRYNDIKNALTSVGDWFSRKFKQAYDGIVNTFQNIGQWFADRYNDIKNALQSVGNWFMQKFQEAWNGLTTIFSGLGSWFGQRWSDVTSVLSNVADWFGNIFGQAYSAVQNAFSSIGSFFSGIWDTVQSIFVNAGQAVGDAVGGAFSGAVNAVLGTIENIVNGFIDMINDAISVINRLPLPFSLGYIGNVYLPRLARGGIVDSPTVAMIGEAGKEAVVPLENTGFLQTMGRVVSSAVVDALGGITSHSGGFTGNGDIIIQIGGHEFGRIAIQEINKEQERAGQVLLNI
nr:MAG TPA: minor tail protein [Caudoviricetes sp.]